MPTRRPDHSCPVLADLLDGCQIHSTVVEILAEAQKQKAVLGKYRQNVVLSALRKTGRIGRRLSSLIWARRPVTLRLTAIRVPRPAGAFCGGAAWLLLGRVPPPRGLSGCSKGGSGLARRQHASLGTGRCVLDVSELAIAAGQGRRQPDVQGEPARRVHGTFGEVAHRLPPPPSATARLATARRRACSWLLFFFLSECRCTPRLRKTNWRGGMHAGGASQARAGWRRGAAGDKPATHERWLQRSTRAQGAQGNGNGDGDGSGCSSAAAYHRAPNGLRADGQRTVGGRAPRSGCGQRSAKQQPWALLLIVSAFCFLHCPQTGADMHRVVSSPDLASMARQCWNAKELPVDCKECLTETPEMRLKKHLDTLKATVQDFGFEALSRDTMTQGAPSPAHAHTSRGYAMTSKSQHLPVATRKGGCPRRRLFDDEHFSTVTPEPSDLQQPSSGVAQRLPGKGVQDPHLDGHGILRRALFSSREMDEAGYNFVEYQHVERSIAVGKPASKTSVICFDFDRTLSQDHLHQMTQVSRTGLTREQAVAAFGGHRRIEHLTAFLTDLEACGAAIHIISLGHKSDILHSLARVGLDHLFTPDRIIGCDELRCLRLVTKAQCIAHVAWLYGLRRSDALLVDDDHEQLIECSESPESDLAIACGGLAGLADGGRCGTYWVRSGRGLTEKDMAAIGGMARTRTQVAMVSPSVPS